MHVQTRQFRGRDTRGRVGGSASKLWGRSHGGARHACIEFARWRYQSAADAAEDRTAAGAAGNRFVGAAANVGDARACRCRGRARPNSHLVLGFHFHLRYVGRPATALVIFNLDGRFYGT